MKPQIVLVLTLLLVPWTVVGDEPDAPAADAPAAVDDERATYEERRLDAEARAEAARAGLAGELSLAVGFPDLVGESLSSPAWIAGRLAVLDERGKERATERNAPLPSIAPPDEPPPDEPPPDEPPPDEPPPDEDAASTLAARAAALDAEDAADARERRFLLAVSAHLDAHPELTRSALAPLRRDLSARFTAAESAFSRAGETEREARARDVLAAEREIERLERLVDGLLRHAVTAAPPPASEEDVALLADPAAAPAAAVRLGLLLPFLDEDARLPAQSALADYTEATAAATPAPAAAVDEGGETSAEQQSELARLALLAEERAQRVGSRLAQRRDEIAEIDAELRQRLQEGRDKATRIAALPLVDPDRATTADALYRELREIVIELREEAFAARQATFDAESELADARVVTTAAEKDDEPEEMKRRRAAEAERLRTADALVAREERHRDDVFVFLKNAKAQRRGWSAEVSDRALQDDRGFLLVDLRSEAGLVWPNLNSLLRHRGRQILEAPSRWRDWNFLRALLVGAFWTLAVAVLWIWTRRRLGQVAQSLMRFLAARLDRYAELTGMELPVRGILFAAVDLTACYTILRLVGEAVPELGLVFFVVLLVALYRLVIALTSLAVAAHPRIRPALMTVEPGTRDLILRTVRDLALWLILSETSSYLAVEVLAAVTLDELLHLFWNGLFLVIAVVLLHLWESVLAAAVRRRDPAHRLVRWLTARRHLRLVRFALSVCFLVLYAVLWLRDAVSRQGGWSFLLHPWRGTVAEEKVVHSELPEEVTRQMLQRECPEPCYVERPKTRERLDQAYASWQKNKRHGTVVLTGRAGDGRHSFLASWCRDQAAEASIRRVRLARRLTTAEDACQWLAEALEIDDPPADAKAFAGRLEAEHDSAVIVLEDLHLAFLRRVNGFDALRFLFAVRGFAGARTFWILSFHGPAWRYLESLGGLVNTEVCDVVVRIEPMKEERLQQLVESRARAAGHEVSYEHLLPREARFDSLARERACVEYFRRLYWASRGNPTVALRLWRQTLEGGANGHLRVVRMSSAAIVQTGGETDLFVLAALHTHRVLTAEELVEVTHLAASRVQVTLRGLEAKRLLTVRSKQYSIEPLHLPAVTTRLAADRFILKEG